METVKRGEAEHCEYDELVKRLRICAELGGECALCLYQGNGCDAMPETPLIQAADAMEEMQKTIDALNEENTLLRSDLDEMRNIYIAEHDARIEEIKRHSWIPVTERLPEKEARHYLCLLDDDSMAVCYWSNSFIRKNSDRWEWHGPNWKKVTYWMPLPEPPKEAT